MKVFNEFGISLVYVQICFLRYFERRIQIASMAMNI